MKITKNYFFLILFFLVLGFSYFYFTIKQASYRAITSFEDCTRAGFPITATYPEQCKLPGKIFTNPNQEKKILGVSSSIQPLRIEDSYQNLSYFFEDREVYFKNGAASLSPTTALAFTQIERVLDINNDTVEDIAFIIEKKEIETKKNSLYLTAALSLNNGHSGLNALYLGTKITPVGLSYENGIIIVTYTDTLSGQKVRHFKLVNNILEEVTTQ